MQMKLVLTALVLTASGVTAIATDAYHACNEPNNGDHKIGQSCKFRGGASSNSDNILEGECEEITYNGWTYKTCVAK